MFFNVNQTRIDLTKIISYKGYLNDFDCGIIFSYESGKEITISLPKNKINEYLTLIDNYLSGTQNKFGSVEETLKHLKDNGFYPKRVLDIGANIGQFQSIIKNIWPQTTVYMIEANKECEPYLRRFNQPYFIEVLGEIDNREVNFYKTKESNVATGNSIYLEKTSFYNESNILVEKRHTKKLSTLFPNETFDFIKLDTQGSELDIMMGGLDLVRKSNFVLIETALKEYNDSAPLESNVINFMKNLGFDNYIIADEHIWPPIESMRGERDDIKDGEVFQRDLLFYKK